MDNLERGPTKGQMAEEIQPQAAPQGQAPQNPIDPNSGGDQAPKQSDVPEKLQGKTPDELIKMYGEAERKLGEMGNQLGEKKRLESEMAVVLQAIHANPELKSGVEREIAKIAGQDTPTNDKPKVEEGDKTQKQLKQAVEGQVIKEFEKDRGLNTLDAQEKRDVYTKIGDELAEMLDPGGNKTLPQLLDSIDPNKLGTYLDKAYKLANMDGEIEKATKAGMLKARQNEEAIFGAIPSSSGSGGTGGLSTEEKEMAKKLGVTEEDYQKNKQN